MTNDEIATMMFDKLQNGRLVGAFANSGPIPSFTLRFENAQEEAANLTFQPALQTQIGSGIAEIKARIEINITEWRK